MATYSQTLSDGANDAQDTADATGFTATGGTIKTVTSTSAAGRFHCGMRFTNVTVAKGSTINSAAVTIDIVNTSTDTAETDIHCDDVDDTDDFTTLADITDTRIPRITTQSSSWDQANMGAGSTVSPQIVDAVGEVINRAGWASGNALMVLFVGRGGVDQSEVLRFGAVEHATLTPAFISIDHDPPPAGGSGNMTLCGVGD